VLCRFGEPEACLLVGSMAHDHWEGVCGITEYENRAPSRTLIVAQTSEQSASLMQRAFPWLLEITYTNLDRWHPEAQTKPDDILGISRLQCISCQN
jgi:hypothetical protein